MRSQRHVRYELGYDRLKGDTAYMHGDRSKLTNGQQYRAARLRGFTPRLPTGAALPVNTVAPAVTGTAQVGQTLTTTNGTWTGSPAPSFLYRWLRNGTVIAGATNSTYVLQVADLGAVIRSRVTGTNDFADVNALSNETAAVIAA